MSIDTLSTDPVVVPDDVSELVPPTRQPILPLLRPGLTELELADLAAPGYG